MNLPVDVQQIILEYSEFDVQLKLINLCKENYDNLKIRKLNHRKITQNILYQKKYDSLEILNVSDNSKIFDVSHLKNTLIELNCSYFCAINQKGIQQLTKLKKLNAWNNSKITDVNHFLRYFNFFIFVNFSIPF